MGEAKRLKSREASSSDASWAFAFVDVDLFSSLVSPPGLEPDGPGKNLAAQPSKSPRVLKAFRNSQNPSVHLRI